MSRPAVRLRKSSGDDSAVVEPARHSRHFWLERFRPCAARANGARRCCRRKIRSCSRCPTQVPRSGIALTSPGSSSSFCCGRSRRPIARSMTGSRSCSIPIMSPQVPGRRGRSAASHAAGRRRDDGLSGARRCGGGEADRNRRQLRSGTPILEIGLHHEQQHQELMLTDILHAFAQNPTNPAYDPDWQWPAAQSSREGGDVLLAGIHTIGHDGSAVFVRQRAPRASGAAPAGAHRARAGDERRVARIHGRRRLQHAVAVALDGWDDVQAQAGARRATGSMSTARGSR